MVNRHFMLFALAFAAALSGFAKTFDVDISTGRPAASNEAYYHGETIEFRAVRGRSVVTNVEYGCIYYQTNGMGDVWWKTDGLTFHPTNDVGAASYRFFLEGRDEVGRDWHANGLLRLLPSPGFTPNEIELPVARLDFATVEVANAPYYDKAETEAKIVELAPAPDYSTNNTELVETIEATAPAPGDYATVSNKAMHAVQTETDPVWNAEKSGYATKFDLETGVLTVNSAEYAESARDAYSAEYATLAEGLRDGQTEIYAGAIFTKLDAAAETNAQQSVAIESNRVNIASHSTAIAALSTNVYTKAETDAAIAAATPEETDPTVPAWAKAVTKPTYTASEVGAAPASLSSTVNTISGKVSALETWSIGDDTQLRVEHAGATNATLTVLYTNKVMYASTVAESNTLAKAAAYTDSRSRELAQAVDSAIASDAWGERTSSGAPSPADALIIEKPKLALTGGGNFSYIEASTGGYWVMSISLGSKWTLESLADAQNPTNPATVAMHDAEGRAAYTVTSTSSREAYAVRGEQYIYCSSIGGNDVITITYPVVADSAPTIEYAPSLTNEFATVDNWPGLITSVVPSGHSGMWTNTVTMVGHPGHGFFRGKYTKAGHIYTRFNQPIGFDQITLGDVTYNITVETVNGKKLMVLTEVQE